MTQGISRAKKKLILDKGTGILPKSLFIGFSIGGALVIWFLKSLGFSQFVTVIFPVGFIISYCALAYKLDSFFLTEEKIGDNAYYLGFLYTLTSLSYALWMFSSGNSAPEYIIGSFGVALWSTIIGVACRVFFSQLRNDPNDIEKSARIRVAETASTLAVDLHQASDTFNSYRIALQQSMEEAFMDLSKKMDAQIIQAIENIVLVSASATDSISKRHEQLNGTIEIIATQATQGIESIRIVAASSTDGINKKYEQFNSTIEELAKSSSRAVSSFDTMSNNVNVCTKDIGIAISELTAVTKLHAQETQSVLVSFNAVTREVDSLSLKVHELSERTTVLDNVTNNTSILSKNIETLLKTFSSGLSAVTDEQKSIIAKMSEHADALKQQLERSRKYTNDTHQSLAQMTHDLAEKLR